MIVSHSCTEAAHRAARRLRPVELICPALALGMCAGALVPLLRQLGAGAFDEAAWLRAALPWVLALGVPWLVLTLAVDLPARRYHAAYETACAKERLSVGADGVSGATVEAAFALRYDEIAEILWEERGDGPLGHAVGHGLLTVRDRAGRTYRFRSFVNGAELRDAVAARLGGPASEA